MSRYFQVPTGTTQNPVFAIIADKLKAPRTVVLGVYIAACELSCEENKKARNRDELLEIIAYTLANDVSNVVTIMDSFEQRGLIDNEGRVKGVETISEAAERKRRQRQREKEARDMSRDSHKPVTDGHNSDCDVSRLTNQPNLTNQTKEPNQRDGVTSVTQEVGSFSGGHGVGSVGRFDIESFIVDDDYIEIYRLAPGWDKQELFRKYNAWVGNDHPRNPRAAFIGWLKKFAKGRKP